jgi:hypothetical protein
MNFTHENSDASAIHVGDKVEVERCGKVEIAYVACIGAVHFAKTTTSNNNFLGLILENPTGKNNGTVQGREYFKCKSNYGVFVRSSTVRKQMQLVDNGDKKVGLAIEKEDTFPAASEGEMLLNFKENLRISKYGDGGSTTGYTSRTTGSKMSAWTKEERVIGRRKNKIKGKKGFLIYNKVV